jgi:hypothetical protein
MIVIIYKPGQLANMLFLFAKFLAYGYKHDVLIINPSFNDYAHYFTKTKNQFIPASRGKGYSFKIVIGLIYKTLFFVGRVLHRLNLNLKYISITYLDWSEYYDLDADEKLYKKGIHFIQGWEFNAIKLMISRKHEIVQFFQPDTKWRDSINEFFQKIKTPKLLIGVHIRHGDYRAFEGGKYFYEIDQYKSVMRLLLEKYRDLRFLICTNNMSISKNDFKELDIVMAPGHELMDLFLLAKCNYIMGPPSTYSLWASFYGDVPLYQIKEMNSSTDLRDFKLFHVV